MSTPTVTNPAAPADAPQAAFLAGYDLATGVHALPAAYAARALAEGRTHTGALCLRSIRISPNASAFVRADLPPWAEVCPTCAWTVAIEFGPDAIAAELDLLTPTGEDRVALAWLTGDALLVRRLCEAILATTPPIGGDGRAGEAAVELLAHASAHAPVLLRDWPCTAGECAHPAGACVTTAASPACSLQAGQWAAAREGAYRAECTIGAPCQVLVTLATHLGVSGSTIPGEAA